MIGVALPLNVFNLLSGNNKNAPSSKSTTTTTTTP